MLGERTRTEICIRNILKEKLLDKAKIENIMLHQIVYCGFPRAMNSFAILYDIHAN